MQNMEITGKIKFASISGALSRIAQRYWKARYLFLLFLPALVYYVIFCYGPMYGVQIAFKDYNFALGITGSEWIGLTHFRRLFGLNKFWQVFSNTIIISSLKLVFGFPAPIFLALLFNEIRMRRFKKVVQTISYLPHFLSWVILASIFIQLLSPTTGPVNQVIKSFGFKEIYFLGSRQYFRSVLVATSIWKGIGWGSVVYLAALSGIDPSLYEAAHMDGANRFQMIRYISLPELTPVITIMFIFAVGGVINDDFDQIFNLYNDAVLPVADVISTYTYRIGLLQVQYSFSTAVGLFKNVIAFALVFCTNALARRFSSYGLW